MESRKENSAERRRRKIIATPVLVRSVKPGQVMSVSYDRPRNNNGFWKEA